MDHWEREEMKRRGELDETIAFVDQRTGAPVTWEEIRRRHSQCKRVTRVGSWSSAGSAASDSGGLHMGRGG